ncbi:MAG: VWA domain-containing protein [Planctomycetota bacterium]|jgi:hypothetical protein|nr:MAG: VWA domain-containing protein [Planctomycetota bacterium]
MGMLEGAKRWWQERTGEDETPLDGDTPAWALSLVIHVAVLLGLGGSILRDDPHPRRFAVVQVSPDQDEAEMDLVPQEMSVSEEPQDRTGAESAESVDIAQAFAPELSEQSIVPVMPTTDVVSDIQVEPLDALPTGPEIDANLIIQGAVGIGTSGAAGAVDRLTMEITSSLDQRPTVVCWVFDQSVSLAGQRKEIAARLQRVSDELGVRAGSDQHELFNLVYAYGKSTMPVITKPTTELGDVKRAIESIPIDESGIEMTFTAIAEAAKAARQVRITPSQRNVMIIAFTDEVGNDQQFADDVARFCRTQAMRVFVVGVPAPFGTRQVSFKFVEFDPKYADDVAWKVVEQGPESLYPEFVRIKTGGEADEPIDSGFGPFSLSKLCAETGGIYFCVHANRDSGSRVSDKDTAPMSSRLRHFFDHDKMRAYRPDYLPAAKIDQMLATNRAKKALVEAAKSSEISPMDKPRLDFPRQDDGALALLLSEAQKKAAVLAPKIDAMYGALAAGLPDRDKISEKRWQAGFDLALGRVLALKVRTDAYNMMLAQAKTGMKFKDAKSDTWVLQPSDDVSNVGSQTEKLAKQSKALLEKVVAEHPATPWARIAAEELRTPLGYSWTERHTGVNDKPKPSGGGGGGGRPGDDPAARKLAPPKPKRAAQNI